MTIDSHFILIPVKHYKNDMHEIKKKEGSHGVTRDRVAVTNGHWNLQALASTQQYLDNRFCSNECPTFLFCFSLRKSTLSDAADTIMVVTCTDKTF